MKVSGVGSTRSPTGPQKKREVGRTDGRSFADHLRAAASPEAPTGVIEPAAVASVDSILSVQQAGDATEDRAREQARQRGERILERLESIRHDLIAGAVPKQKLMDLAQSLREKRQQIKDQRLIEILDEIELRAEVEIAKLTRDI